MFAQQEGLVNEIVAKNAAMEKSTQAQLLLMVNRLKVLEGIQRDITPTLQTMDATIVKVHNEALQADVNPRQEIQVFPIKPQASEDHVKAVSNEFSEHVAGAFATASSQLHQLQQQVSSVTFGFSGGTGAARKPKRN